MVEMPVWMNSRGIGAGGRVERRRVDAAAQIGDDGRAVVAGFAETAEDPSEDLRREGDLQGLVEKTHPGVFDIQIVGTLEDLHQHLPLGAADHLAIADSAGAVADQHPVAEGDVGGIRQRKQAAPGLGDGAVLGGAHQPGSSCRVYSERSIWMLFRASC